MGNFPTFLHCKVHNLIFESYVKLPHNISRNFVCNTPQWSFIFKIIGTYLIFYYFCGKLLAQYNDDYEILSVNDSYACLDDVSIGSQSSWSSNQA